MKVRKDPENNPTKNDNRGNIPNKDTSIHKLDIPNKSFKEYSQFFIIRCVLSVSYSHDRNMP